TSRYIAAVRVPVPSTEAQRTSRVRPYSPIPAWGCPRKNPSRSLTRSLPPSPKAAEWDWRSAVPLWSRMVADCGQPPTMDEEQHFISLCRPQLRCTTQLRREIALDLVTALPPTTRSFSCCGNLSTQE